METVLARIAPPPQKDKGTRQASKAGTTSTTIASKAKGGSRAETTSTAIGGKGKGVGEESTTQDQLPEAVEKRRKMGHEA